MKKTLVMAFIMILLLPATVFGYGIDTNTMWDEYPNALDFRKYKIVEDMNKLVHPVAGFEIEVVSPNGTSKQSSTEIDNVNGRISSDFDNNSINALVGSELKINERTQNGSGSKITQYDIQYRFTPEDRGNKKREDFEIKPAMVGSWSAVQSIIEKIELTEPGELEIYLAVADNTKCLAGATNWSVNGNVRSLNTDNPNFPDGIFWYFTGVVVKIQGAGPDFYPTPEGSTEWKPEYKDPNICAMTYNYKPGETSITFPVTLNNSGSAAVTDFKAVFYGSSSVNPNTWNEPLWQAEIKEPITPDKPQTFDVTIPLPPPSYSKGIVAFKANVDGNTPEVNQDNNLMLIKLAPDGVDVFASLPQDRTYTTFPGKPVNITLPLFVGRKDAGAPVDTDVKCNWPGGSLNETTVVNGKGGGGGKTYDINFSLSKAGTYYVTAEAWPQVTDIDPSNNKDQMVIIIKVRGEQPDKENPDNQIRVNLRS